MISATDEATESAVKIVENKFEQLGKDLAEDIGIPPWGLVAILIGNEVTFDEPDPNQSGIIDSYYL